MRFSKCYLLFSSSFWQCCGSGSGIRDWVPFWPLDPGSGMGESQHPDPGWTTRIIYFLELRNHFFDIFGVKILKFFVEDPGSGMETVRIRDPGWKKVGSGIRDKHPGSATLLSDRFCFFFRRATSLPPPLCTGVLSWGPSTPSSRPPASRDRPQEYPCLAPRSLNCYW